MIGRTKDFQEDSKCFLGSRSSPSAVSACSNRSSDSNKLVPCRTTSSGKELLLAGRCSRRCAAPKVTEPILNVPRTRWVQLLFATRAQFLWLDPALTVALTDFGQDV